MMPDLPIPWAPSILRDRNRYREGRGPNDERCILCEAPIGARRIGINVDLAKNMVMDPGAPYRPDSGVVWIGASCAKKIPASYRIQWRNHLLPKPANWQGESP